MYTKRADFVYTVTRDFVRSCQTPILVLPDDVPGHPYAVAMESVRLAPKSEVSIYPWKDPKDLIPQAVQHVRKFLSKRSPGYRATRGRMPCSMSAGWEARRSRLPAERCLTGGCDIGEDVAMLLLQRGHHRHHRFDTAGAFRALGPKAPLAPEDPWPNRPLGGVVRGLHPFVPHERPQGLPQLEQLPGRCPPSWAPHTCGQLPAAAPLPAARAT